MSFSNFPDEIREAAEVHLDAGRQVFSQGDEPQNYLIVTEGCVKVFARSAEGREVVLYRVEPGDICVLTTSCMLAGTPYPAEGIAESDVTAIALPKSAFDNLIATSDSFRGFVLSSFGDRLAGLVMLVEQVTLASIGQRLARFLLDRSNGGSDALVLTHQEIAAEIGSAREVVSRQLKSFETSGWVTLGHGSVRVVDTAALGRLSGEADAG